jgi:LuxR family transcriptional regulator, maltose regulon positive regulatory protein
MAGMAAGWEALRCADWERAQAIFEQALQDAESALAHEGLSWALWWVNDGAAVLAARERAYELYRDSGDIHGAARMATWLASDVLDFRGEPVISGAWLERAHHLIDGAELAPEHGWLDLHEGTIALDLEADSVRARRLGDRCAATGRTLGVIDLEMLGMALAGQAAVHEGDIREGMRLLDQAALAATTGELDELVAVGWSCCSLIKACEEIRDHERAAQWAQQTLTFAQRVRFDPWFGICRSFYASVLASRGAWTEAEAELVAAAELMASTRPPWAGEALVRLGELRLRQGRLPEAEQLFAEVGPHPRAMIGEAEIALTKGDAVAALRLGERALRNLRATEQTGRVPVLEVLVRAAVAAGDIPSAQRYLSELLPLVDALGTPALRASSAMLGGVVASAAGDAAGARRMLEEAVDGFTACEARYDGARARAELARALATTGEAIAARHEMLRAIGLLADMGAASTVEQLERELRDMQTAERVAELQQRAGNLTPRELEILRLVADGLSDRAMASQLGLSDHTVHRHVSNILTKLGVPSRSAAVATAVRNQLL